MMQTDNSEKEEHLMCVICEFEDSFFKIFVVSRVLSLFFQKCLVNTNKDASLNSDC